MIASIRRLMAIAFLSLLFMGSRAQITDSSSSKEPRPYKISNSGKELTIKSSRTIQTIMLWTTDGHRVVEQREINNNSCSFSIPVNNKFFFLMVGMEGGKVYTEKIGLR